MQKDTHNSIFLEFFYIDPVEVPTQGLPELIQKLLERQDLKIVEATNHAMAPKFKAHANHDFK